MVGRYSRRCVVGLISDSNLEQNWWRETNKSAYDFLCEVGYIFVFSAFFDNDFYAYIVSLGPHNIEENCRYSNIMEYMFRGVKYMRLKTNIFH